MVETRSRMGGGQTFGRFRVLRALPQESVTVAFVAEDQGRACILERLHPAALRDAELARAFLEEAQLAKMLDHPSVVRVLDVGTVEDEPYFVSERIQAVTLARFCRWTAQQGAKLPLDLGLFIALALFEALEAAHRLADMDSGATPFAHGGLTPARVLIAREGTIKLIDFVAARLEARFEQARKLRSDRTYLAPEQTTGAEITRRADLFAAGIVVTELIGGQRLFPKGGVPLSIFGVSKRVRALLEQRADIPAPLAQLMLELTASEPMKRPAAAEEVAARLRSIAARLTEGDDPIVALKASVARMLALSSAAAESTTAAAAPLVADLSLGEDSWANADDEKTSSGWAHEAPAEEQVEVVARSSSVDAMQFFAAQGSADAPVSPLRAPPPSRSPSLPPAPPQDPLDRAHWPRLLELDAPADKKKQYPLQPERTHYLIAGAVLFAAVGLFVTLRGIAGLFDRPGSTTADTGGYAQQQDAAQGPVWSAQIGSDPPGALIFVDGESTGKTTPATIGELLLDRHHISVTLEGFVPPRPADVLRPKKPSDEMPGAQFRLVPGRAFRIETTPPGADVTIKGQLQDRRTPLELDAIPIGESMRATVEHAGYFPATLELVAREPGREVRAVELSPARAITVRSEPTDAQVFLDGTLKGQTPILELLLPVGRKSEIKVERLGYQAQRIMFDPAKRAGDELMVTLKELPLRALPMTAEEKHELAKLETQLSALRPELQRAKNALARAEAEVRRLERGADLSLASLESAQKDRDAARERRDEVAVEVEQAENAKKDLREVVLIRLGNH